MLQVKRTVETFLERNSKRPINTQFALQKALHNFEKFCKARFDGRGLNEIVDELSLSDEETIFDTLQEWINWNDGKLYPTSLGTYFAYLKLFLYYKGIKLTPLDVKQNLVFPKQPEEELYPLSEDDIKKILDVAPYKRRGMYLAQLSSAMRIGEMVQLRKKHFDLSKKRIIVKIPANITKLQRARTTFISKEAEPYLRKRLKQISDDDLVWASNDDPNYAKVNEANRIREYCAKAGLNERYEGNNRHKITTHSFRAFFITKLSRHDENFAKKLAGQKGYLLQYDRMTDEEKLEKYIEFEPNLLIFDQAKKNAEIEKLQKEKSELEKKEREIDGLKENMEKIIEEKIGEYNQKFLEKVNKIYDERILESKKRLDAADRDFKRRLEMDADKEFSKSEKFKQMKKILYED